MISIRSATGEDIPRIIDLYDKLSIGTTRLEMERNPSPEDYLAVFEDIQADPGHELLVAEEDGEVKGSVVLLVVPNLSHRATPWALVENLIVDPGNRQKGIGRMLLEHVVELAKRRGCHRVEVMSDRRRVEAHRLYQSVGFEPSAYGFRLFF